MTTPSMRAPRLGVSYSQALAAAYASAPEEEIILDTIELNHPTFSFGGVPIDDHHATSIFVVNDHIAFDAVLEDDTAVTFNPCAFQFTRPEESSASSLPEVQVQIDNVSKILIPFMQNAIQSRIPITMIWRPYLASDPSGPHMLPVLTLTLRSVSADMNSMTAKAGFTDLTNLRFPGKEYKSKQFPGLTVR